jgi:hypothetical protein
MVRTFLLVLFMIAGTTTAQADRPPEATHADASDSLPEIHRIASAAMTDADTVSDARSLAATTAPPWNPPEPMNPRRRWERYVLMPGHLLSLPLAGLGRLTEFSMNVVEGANLLPEGFNPSPHQAHRVISVGSPGLNGFGAAVEVYRPIFPGHLETALHARLAGTIYGYNATELGLEGRPLSLGYGYEWMPRERFYGIGPGTPQRPADYAVQSEHFGVRLDHLRQGPRKPGEPEGTRFSLWAESRTDVTSSGRDPGLPSYVLIYPDVAIPTVGERVDHMVYGGSVSFDERAGVPHWYHGGRLLLSAERYGAPVDALTLHGSPTTGAEYMRYEGVAETGFSFFRDPRTVRLMVRVVDERPDAASAPLLPSEMATLGGGREGLAGFDRGRFHDLDLALGRVSYIVPVSRRLEFEAHSEWGSVYHDVWTDARFSSLEHSFGLALRGRYELGVLASIGADFSREGYRVSYSLGSTR